VSADGLVVSVVIPARNSATTVRRSIESALAQAAVVDVIVVDDGSTDETSSVANSVSDPRVHVLRQVAGGVGSARNRGASQAQGEWLLFLDSDDELVEGAISQLVADRIESDVFLVCGRATQRRNDESLAQADLPRIEGPIVQPLLAGTFLVRTTAFLAIGGYEERLRFSENTDLAIRLLDGHSPSHCVEIRDVAMITRPFDAPSARATKYSEQIVEAAEFFLREHRSVLDQMNATASYASSGGVAAARLRRWRLSKHLFTTALRARGRRPSDLIRLAAACVPGIRTRIWR